MKSHTNYPSAFAIGDTVAFVPMHRHQKLLGIAEEVHEGKIVAIKFTAAKVWYDIIDDYHGFLFDMVDSAKVADNEANILYLQPDEVNE